MDGAFGRHRNISEPAQQALTDFARTPAGVLTLHVQDVVLYLESCCGVDRRMSNRAKEAPARAAAIVSDPLTTKTLRTNRHGSERQLGGLESRAFIPLSAKEF
jgi:hypothetical protein